MCVYVCQASSHASRRCDVAAADRLPAAFKSENKKNIPVKKRGGRAGGGAEQEKKRLVETNIDIQMALVCENLHQNLTEMVTLAARQAEREINRQAPH